MNFSSHHVYTNAQLLLKTKFYDSLCLGQVGRKWPNLCLNHIKLSNVSLRFLKFNHEDYFNSLDLNAKYRKLMDI